MAADTFAAFYAHYVEFSVRAGVEPVAPDRAAAILAELGPLNPVAATFIAVPSIRRAVSGSESGNEWW